MMDAKKVSALDILHAHQYGIECAYKSARGQNRIDTAEALREFSEVIAAVSELISASNSIWLDYDGDLPFIAGLDRLNKALSRIGSPA